VSLPIRLLIAMCMCILTGCVHNKTGAQYVYPAGWEDICARATEDARGRIGATGATLDKGCRYVVLQRPCTERVNDLWAWTDPPSGKVVGGLTAGVRGVRAASFIGCSPDGTDPDYGVLVHEAGHYWLGVTFGEWGHPPEYKEAFGW